MESKFTGGISLIVNECYVEGGKYFMRFVSSSFVKNRRGRCLVSMLTIMALVVSSFVLPVHTMKSSAEEGTSSYGLSNPTISNGVTTWDCIYFGNYYQSNSSTKEPIKWRVLSVNGNDAFLLADQNLDAKPYNEEYTDVTWATCTLRTWLNDTFFNMAFTSAEQVAIKNTTVVNDDNPYYDTEGGENTTDKVYLLSIAEASNTAYGFNGKFRTSSETRVATNTAYVAGKEGMHAVGFANWWWLRSPGASSDGVSYIDNSGEGGSGGWGVSVDYIAVRPALHLNLSSSSLWRYAGKVSSDGSVDLPTPSPTNTPAPVYSFRRGIDNNSFCHNNGNDSNWYCPYNAKYETDTKYLKSISSGFYEYLSLLNKSRSKWNGSCYGISMGMTLNKGNKVNLGAFNAKSFYQLQPYSNELARKYLNFLYLSQFSSKYGGLSLTAETTRTDGSGSCTKSEFLQKFVKEVQKWQAKGVPVMLLYHSQTSGHAIIATSVYENSDNYEVFLYDMNSVGSKDESPRGEFSTMIVEKDFSDFSYKDATEDKWEENYQELRYFNTEQVLNGPYSNAETKKKANAKTSEISGEDNGNTLIVSDGIKVTDKSGDTLEFEDSKMTGSINVIDYIPIYGSVFGNEEKNLQYLAQIPESDSYTVEPEQDNTDITLYGENSFVAVNGQNIEQITTSENTTEVEGDKADYSISVPAEENNCNLYQVKLTSDNAVYNYSNGELYITSNDGMSNISVNACRDTDYAGEQEVSITANEIKITPVKAENDKVSIVASNKDGKSEQIEITLKSIQQEEKANSTPVPTPTPTTIKSQNSNVGKGNTSSTAGQKILRIPQVKGLKILSQSKKVKKSKTCKVTLSWKKVTGAKCYQLQYALNKKFKKKKSIQTKKTKYTIKKLKKNKTYYIRVRAYKMNGRKKVYGKWSKVKKVKIKK